MASHKRGRVVNKHTMIMQDWTAVAQNTIMKSTEYDLLNSAAALLHIQAALDTVTAHTGTRFLVQVSSSEAGNENWQDLVEFVALVGTAVTDAIENNPLAAGATSITLTGHSLTTLGEWLFIEDGTLEDSELVFEKAQTTNSISLLDGTTNEHAAATNLYNVAMEQNISLSSSVRRARVIVDNAYDGDGSTLNYKVRITEVLEV